MKKVIIFLILTFVLIFIGSFILVWQVLPRLIPLLEKSSANISEDINKTNRSNNKTDKGLQSVNEK